MSQFLIRPARKEDCLIILDLIRGLAKYEKLEDQCVATVELLENSLFSEKPDCYSVIAWELDDLGEEIPVGFALYFFNYFHLFKQARSLSRGFICCAAVPRQRLREANHAVFSEDCGRERMRSL